MQLLRHKKKGASSNSVESMNVMAQIAHFFDKTCERFKSSSSAIPASHKSQGDLIGLACISTIMLLAICGCDRSLPLESEPAAKKQAVTPFAFTPRAPLSERDSHDQMLSELAAIRSSTNVMIDWLGDARAKSLRNKLEASNNSTVEDHIRLRHELATCELRLGHESEAIDLLLEGLRIVNSQEHSLKTDDVAALLNEFDFTLGVAYLRLGEVNNCCKRNTSDSCIVPIRGGGLHTDPAGSQAAAKCFERLLKRNAKGSLIWLRSLWLYNISMMTIGQFPDGIPDAWRLPESAFRSSNTFPTFVNIAATKGVDTLSLAGGAIADDFNGDGVPDLVVSTMDTAGQLRLFESHGFDFRDSTVDAGLSGLLGGLNLIQADYDNDGFVDILVLRGGWFQSGGKHPNSLLRNNGDGTFTDVSFAAGIKMRAPTQTASWADFDNDGDLDLYVGNETTESVPIPSQLYESNGDGTFMDVSAEAGVRNSRLAKAVVWGDFNHDQFPDLFVSNFGQENRLYRNNGDRTFTDVARQLNVSRPLRSFPAWFWDYNNDGLLDLYVSAYADDISHIASHLTQIGSDGSRVESSSIYTGTPEGGFEDLAKQLGVDFPTAPMGANFGDFDNDGFLDFYLGTGEPEYRNLMPNVAYWNREGNRFDDVTMSGRFGHLQKGHAVVFADLDMDGDQDVFEQIGGAFPGDAYFDAIFQNPGFNNNWIMVKLHGRHSSSSAVGARIEVIIRENNARRSIFRSVCSGGSFGANPLTQWFGLGKATSIEAMKIMWPASGETQSFSRIAANQRIVVREGNSVLCSMSSQSK